MPKPKGSPKTGGRQKGVPNKRTEQREAAVQEAAELIRTVIPDAFDGDSHALLMAVYKDPRSRSIYGWKLPKLPLPMRNPA